MNDVKLYRGEDGFYPLIAEAKGHNFISSDYNTGNSEYVTSIYQSDTHEYRLVENIDLGVWYSAEKLQLKK